MFDDTRDMEDYVRSLMNNIPGAIFRDQYLGEDKWRLDYVSDQIEAITGVTAADFVYRDKRSYIQMAHVDDAAMVKIARRQAIEQRSEYSLEYRLVDAHGAVRWVAENGQANIKKGAQSHYLDGILSDISERKKAESLLVESDKRYRAFVESTESIVVYLDPRGLLLEFNPAAEDLYGMSRQEVLGKNYFKLFLPEEIHEAVAADMKKVLAGTPTRGFENEIITRAGVRRVISWYVIRTLDINGEPSGIVASGHDITSRKLAEEALLESQKMLQLVLDSIPVRVAWKDRNQTYLGCNRLFARDAGLDSQEAIFGKNDYDLGDREQAELYRADDREVMESGVSKLNHEARYTLPGGKNVWFSANRVPLTDLKNNIIGMLSTYEDITDRRKAELQAAARNLRLKRLTELSLTLSGDPADVFQNVARMIGELLDVRIVCLSIIRDEEMQFMSLYIDGEMISNPGSHPLATTPCASVVASKDVRIYDNVIDKFPEAEFLKDYEAYSYCGFPVLDSDGNVAAITCLLDSNPHIFSEEDLGLLRIFGQRIAVEIERQQHLDEQAHAKEQMKKLSSALEQTADVVLITDKNGLIEYVNPAFEVITGYSFYEVKGRSSNIIKSYKHDDKFYKYLWDTILKGEVFQDIIINRKKSGELYYEEKTITPLKDAKGNITHFISTGKDITERMQTQERIYHLAYHDLLTQLPNRGLFVDRLNHALARQRDPNKFLAVLFIDLDRFKIINDTLGHDIGDRLLKMFSERIVKCLREGDTVARLAGDEFVILLEDITASEDVAPICRKILDSLTLPFQADGKELFVTGSIGISLNPADGVDAASLIRNADIAMYRAKELGRNNYQFYSSDMSVRAFERLNLETNLRHALKRDEFLIYYQPQVSSTTGKIVGVEALLRWRHPELGLLLPDQFISLLEETGLIISVGEWVLQAALSQAKKWQKMGFSPIRVSINLSSRQFDATCLKKIVMDLLEEIGLSSDWVGLEITESLLMNNENNSQETLRGLSMAGIQISIDDFGTGYSSLSYLKRLPIDTLKIDGSFIRDVIINPDDTAIVQAIIAMAKTLKLDVIAEGVETREQLEFVRSSCVAIQGFVFSKPLPVDAATELLRQDNHSGIDWERVYLANGEGAE